MSSRKIRRVVAIAIVAFLLAAIALLPMRMAFGALSLDRFGVTASAIEGSIWSGRIEQLHVGRINLGTMRASLSPIQLLMGRARIDLSRRNGTPDDLTGAISVSRHSFAIDDATGAVPMEGMFAPLPLSAVDLDDVSVRFTDGVCERAEGKVHARIRLVGQVLTGSLRCDGARVLVLLGDGGGPARIELRIAADGSYTGAMVTGAGLGPVLSAFGLAPGTNGLRLQLSGRLR